MGGGSLLGPSLEPAFRVSSWGQPNPNFSAAVAECPLPKSPGAGAAGSSQPPCMTLLWDGGYHQGSLSPQWC